MGEQTYAQPDPIAAARATTEGQPSAARPLIEGLQVIANGAPVCDPDDPFCELPAPATLPAQPATDARTGAR